MRLRYDGHSMEVRNGETVLECMERHGVNLPSSCRSGVCQSCILRATRGSVPDAAQLGLTPVRKAQGYFMACQCRPTVDMEIGHDAAALTHESFVVRAEALSDRVVGIGLAVPEGFHFEAGQFIQVIRPADGMVRPYSIASLPDAELLELHVALTPNGRMSGWLPSAVGQKVWLKGPLGECIYDSGSSTDTLVLAGTGTGLAPLLGILRAAIRARHQGAVRLYHGARTESGLYGRRVLQELQRRHLNLQVIYATPGCAEQTPAPEVRRQALEGAVLEDLADSENIRAYLCGNPEVVKNLRKQLYLAGVALDRIHADAFVVAPPPSLQ